jgi:hypothetical protein
LASSQNNPQLLDYARRDTGSRKRKSQRSSNVLGKEEEEYNVWPSHLRI